jgi:hypothetical protein
MKSTAAKLSALIAVTDWGYGAGYAFLSNFVDEPLSRFQLETLPNGGGNGWFVLGL